VVFGAFPGDKRFRCNDLRPHRAHSYYRPIHYAKCATNNKRVLS